MARKSNKTAHVLNLLAAGHDSAKEHADETEAVKETADEAETVQSTESSETPAPESVETPVQSVTESVETSAPRPVQSVSVIDRTENDPVAEPIQQKLMEELEADLSPEPIPELEAILEPEVIPETEVIPELNAMLQTEDMPESEVISEPEIIPEPEITPEPEVIPEPEPDFVVVNVMERIVKDKVIYFMREFEVCTCERCIADTISLTLNGLEPKYVVTAPMAVDPLISFYTNRFISDVTVQITKACMTIKENPRH